MSEQRKCLFIDNEGHQSLQPYRECLRRVRQASANDMSAYYAVNDSVALYTEDFFHQDDDFNSLVTSILTKVNKKFTPVFGCAFLFLTDGSDVQDGFLDDLFVQK